MLSHVKGTQDWLDLTLFNALIQKARTHLALYNYHEIATPLIEQAELFNRSLGQHTDVITKEMFLIVPRNDDDVLCLRPEATASIARSFIENSIQKIPWKVFTYGPMFRYERPQKGRLRQFNQLSIECIGSASITQDVELITMLDRFFRQTLLLQNYGLTINFLGCPSDRISYKNVLYVFLAELDLNTLCTQCKERKERNILRIFDCKVESCKTIYAQAPRTADHLCADCADQWKVVRDQLEESSVAYAYTPSLVRGLDYYTKTVFEFVSSDLGAQNAFCGGGRYDQLVKELGSKKEHPALGAAIGLERLLILLEGSDNQMLVPQRSPLHVIIPFSVKQHGIALFIADMVRDKELAVEILLEEDSLKSMMRQANRIGAAYCLLLGDREQAEHSVTVKNMVTGQEQYIKQNVLLDCLKL